MTPAQPPLITPAELLEVLDDPNLVVIDASWYMPGSPNDARAEHAERHIQGAVFFDIDEVADHSTGLPHMMPDPSEFAVHVRRLGVEPDSTVVVYDSAGLFSAPRVWWAFRAMGHDKVYVLDGGLPAWIADGHPVEQGWPQRDHGEFKAHANPDLVRDIGQVRAALAEGSAQLIDARSAPRFRGDEPEPRAGLRSGHMPDALNLPWGALVKDGRLVDPAHLYAAFAGAGVDLEQPIITTCGSGVSAAILSLGLARLGRWDAPVYDGSWAEWGAAADAPVATGAA